MLEPLNESLNETLRGFEKIVSLSTQQDVGEEKNVKASTLLAVRRSNSKQRQLNNPQSQSHKFESPSMLKAVGESKQLSPSAGIRAKLEVAIKQVRGDAEPRKPQIVPQTQDSLFSSANSARDQRLKLPEHFANESGFTKSKVVEAANPEAEETPVRQPQTYSLKENRNPSKGNFVPLSSQVTHVSDPHNVLSNQEQKEGQEPQRSQRPNATALANHLRDLRKASGRGRTGRDNSHSSAHNSLSRSFVSNQPVTVSGLKGSIKLHNHSFGGATTQSRGDGSARESPPHQHKLAADHKVSHLSQGMGNLQKSDSLKGVQIKPANLQVPQQLVAKLERFGRQIQKLSSNFDLVATSLQVRPTDDTQMFEKEMRRYLREMDKTMKAFLDKTTHY